MKIARIIIRMIGIELSKCLLPPVDAGPYIFFTTDFSENPIGYFLLLPTYLNAFV